MKKEKALQIIEKNRESYDKVAEDFDLTRKADWPEFEILKNHINKYYRSPDLRQYRILDIGCGNGRLYEYLSQMSNVKCQMSYTGIDQSEKLVEIAKKENPKANFQTIENITKLPFKDGEFDLVAGIAFLHHIPGKELRLKTLKEIYRVLKPKGTLFLTNWNLWQWTLIKKYKLRIRDFFFKHNGLDAGDFWISFSSRRHTKKTGKWSGRRADRYYHHFKESELKRLCRKAGFKQDSCQKARNVVMFLHK